MIPLPRRCFIPPTPQSASIRENTVSFPYQIILFSLEPPELCRFKANLCCLIKTVVVNPPHRPHHPSRHFYPLHIRLLQIFNMQHPKGWWAKERVQTFKQKEGKRKEREIQTKGLHSMNFMFISESAADMRWWERVTVDNCEGEEEGTASADPAIVNCSTMVVGRKSQDRESKSRFTSNRWIKRKDEQESRLTEMDSLREMRINFLKGHIGQTKHF